MVYTEEYRYDEATPFNTLKTNKILKGILYGTI